MSFLTKILTDESETLAFAKQLAALLPEKICIYLHGPLGAGKTTFTRGVIQAFGHTGLVKSPTYTLVEPYYLSTRAVYHFDLYRLAEPEELEFIGIRDYASQQAILIIEWPEKGKSWLPPADLELFLTIDEQNHREIKVVSNGAIGTTILTKLR